MLVHISITDSENLLQSLQIPLPLCASHQHGIRDTSRQQSHLQRRIQLHLISAYPHHPSQPSPTLLIFVGLTSALGSPKSQYLAIVFGGGKLIHLHHSAEIASPTSRPNMMTASHNGMVP